MRKVTAIMLLLLVTLLLLSLSMPACSCAGDEGVQPPLTSGSVVVVSDSSVPSSVAPDVCGKITSISFSSDSAIMLVERDKGDNAENIDKAIITVDKKTAVGKENSTESFNHFALSAGDTVEVWFVNSVAETYPIQAYAQAVKVLKSDAGADANGIINLPKMTVNCGSSSYLAAVSDVTWNKKFYDYGKPEDVLAGVMGSNLSVRSGEAISLAFNMTPDSYTVLMLEADSGKASSAVEVTDGRINIPKESTGNYIYTVNVVYGENNVTYVFSVFAFA